jgi:hypothetical protein
MYIQVRDALDCDRDVEDDLARSYSDGFTTEQRVAFEKIDQATELNTGDGGFFFLTGPGGTGKSRVVKVRVNSVPRCSHMRTHARTNMLFMSVTFHHASHFDTHTCAHTHAQTCCPHRRRFMRPTSTLTHTTACSFFFFFTCVCARPRMCASPSTLGHHSRGSRSRSNCHPRCILRHCVVTSSSGRNCPLPFQDPD